MTAPSTRILQNHRERKKTRKPDMQKKAVKFLPPRRMPSGYPQQSITAEEKKMFSDVGQRTSEWKEVADR